MNIFPDQRVRGGGGWIFKTENLSEMCINTINNLAIFWSFILARGRGQIFRGQD